MLHAVSSTYAMYILPMVLTVMWVHVYAKTSVKAKRAGGYPFEDIHLSWEERVDDLVGRLSLDEMSEQMARGGRNTYAPAIPRLGIKPYGWGVECLRGDVKAGNATSFPQSIGLAASFSTELMYNMSLATGLEVRAKHNNYSRHGDYSEHTGASCWSPVINIMRDPRWGRNQETYGEDPYLSGQLAQAYVQGLQGDHPRYIRANAGCKHYAVYAGPENIPISRLKFDAQVSERDLRMTFLPQFKACVQAGTYSIMCSYNSVNGIPACANKKLLTDILREEWGFNGYVISDEGALEAILYRHNYTTNVIDTVVAAINAGTNLEDGQYPQPYPTRIFEHIAEAVNQSKLSLNTVRQAVKPLFYTRMRLGEFDPDNLNPYAQLVPGDYVQSAAHRELAVTAAMATFVLLKNDNFLPLKADKIFNQMAIVGPMADNKYEIFGSYAPTVDEHYVKTPRMGLKGIAKVEKYAAGCTEPWCAAYDAAAIKEAVVGSDIIIVCLGTGPAVENEGKDRIDINLPGKQLQLLQDAVNFGAGVPVLLLLFNGGPLDVSWAQNSPNVLAIVECFFPAQATGEALYRMFYNKGVGANPAARLPATWPTKITQVPSMVNYTMEGRTYRYFVGGPLYPFGYGLSYTNFTYRTLSVRPSHVPYGDPVTVETYVANTGAYDGEEVIQIYISWANETSRVPNLQLVGFKRITLVTGLGQSVRFIITREQLSIWDDNHGFILPKGLIKVYVGGQQPNQSRSVGSNILSSSFRII